MEPLTSNTSEWETPQDLFDRLDQAFAFTLDVCTTPDNAKCPQFYTLRDNGLHQKWRGRVWMNPPYGRGIDAWLKKAIAAADQGALIVALLPVRTDTKWWQDLVVPHALVYYLRGRLTFLGGNSNAPFGSALAIYFPRPDVATNQLPLKLMQGGVTD